MNALVDTSVFVGVERRGAPLDGLEHAGVSAVTIGELGLGVEMASEAKERSLRAATLAVAEDRFDVVGFDQATAIEYSRLMGDARRRGRRPSVQDMIIAATAVHNRVPLITQDVGFFAFPELDVILV